MMTDDWFESVLYLLIILNLRFIRWTSESWFSSMSILFCSYLLYLRHNWWDALYPMTRDDEFDTRERRTVVYWSSRLWKIVKSFCARRWRSDTDRCPIEYERLPTDFFLEHEISIYHNEYMDYIVKIGCKKLSYIYIYISTIIFSKFGTMNY